MKDEDVYSVIKKIKSTLGDRRTCKYAFNFEKSPMGLRIVGKVDTKESYEKIKRVLFSFGEKVEFNIGIMEDEIDDSHKIAVVKSVTCDMKSSPDFRSSNVHQLVFGESAKILDFSKDYVLAKDMRTGFIGWLRYSSLFFMSEKTFHEWKNSGIFVTVKKRFSLAEFSSENFYLPFGVKIPATEKELHWICEFPNGIRIKLKKKDVLPSSEIKKEEIRKIWKMFLGTPYLWGGTSVYGVDCSGYVGRLYDYIGVEIPRDSDQQQEFAKNVKESELKVGDLAFFAGHVAFYIGNGKIVHANLHHGMVGISNLIDPKTVYEIGLKEHLIKFGRILE